MTFTIPTWALWALAALIGVPTIIVILALAWFGFYVARSFSKRGSWK